MMLNDGEPNKIERDFRQRPLVRKWPGVVAQEVKGLERGLGCGSDFANSILQAARENEDFTSLRGQPAPGGGVRKQYARGRPRSSQRHRAEA